MATGKRYYWIKLKDSFMTSDTVDFLMSQPNGAQYVVLYQMLCLKTINTDGRLERKIGEVIIPYDVDKIQRDCKWFSTDTIRVALNLYRSFGLIYEDNGGTLVLADHSNLVGSETDAAARMRSSRASRNELPEAGVTTGEQCSNNVTPDIRDKEYRDKENRDKRTEIRNAVGGEPSNDGSCPAPGEPPVFQIPLNDGSFYDVTQSEIEKYSKLYPAVDVTQEYRKMIGWCDANSEYRKTRRGISRFINRWLSKTQDEGGHNNFKPAVRDRNQYDYSPQPQGNPFEDATR